MWSNYFAFDIIVSNIEKITFEMLWELPFYIYYCLYPTHYLIWISVTLVILYERM
jgi:hypothetical protein